MTEMVSLYFFLYFPYWFFQWIGIDYANMLLRKLRFKWKSSTTTTFAGGIKLTSFWFRISEDTNNPSYSNRIMAQSFLEIKHWGGKNVTACATPTCQISSQPVCKCHFSDVAGLTIACQELSLLLPMIFSCSSVKNNLFPDCLCWFL